MQENVLPKEGAGYLTLQDLGVQATSMDKVAFEFLHRFRKGGHFTLTEGYH